MTEWLRPLKAAAADPEPHASKAAEWLLDNDYQIRRAIRQVARDMPEDFYHRLPALGNDEDEGNPRVLALAYGYLHASHLQLSLGAAVQFVRVYQESAPLTIGELWAFPTMLRLACLEILTDACGRLFPAVRPPFVPTRYVGMFGTFDDTDRVARALTNVIGITSVPWKDFFDRTSLVEATLRKDPAGVYPRMDFETRDRYRKAVEELAAGAGIAELKVAEEAVSEAGGVPEEPCDHVGHWLVGGGRYPFERLLGYGVPFWTACSRWLRRHPGLLYVTALFIASTAALVLPVAYLAIAGAGPVMLVLGAALTALPASVLGVTFVHWLITRTIPPRVLPKLDFEKGIPEDCPTVVAIPVIIRKADEIRRLMERLEAHRLANPDPSLRFVLLSDFADAPQEHAPGDEAIEQELLAGIRRLNQRYGSGESRPFHLLHRPRRQNPCEGSWMGWERKRGKLEEFNRLVLEGDRSRFSLFEGDTELLRRVRFVVTVDADTVLPPGAVGRLAGTLAHPLNEARFDARSHRVHSGYTILQPRVEISPLSGNRSPFARLYAGNTAIDIYSRAVSDVYQDLFGEGIYVGKGIYEVASFHKSLEGRVPENALVSHDLFEGVHGRAALASDIVLYEDFPAGYVEYARRWHRWVRGDWQLLPWLMRHVPGQGGERFVNELSTLDRWKILDNFRRSLIPLSLLVLVLAGWLVLPGSALAWTLLTVAAPGAYLFTDLVTGLARGPRRGAMQGLLHNLADHSGRWALAIVFLVHDAAVAVDAIARTCWRLCISRRHLLEWTSAAHTAAAVDGAGPRIAAWRYMWLTPVFSVLAAAAILFVNPPALIPAAPLLAVWLISPEIAVLISRRRKPAVEEVQRKDRAFLRRLARRTWLYFETFVGPTDNWLPPDNFQEEPHSAIAHRTSPTNIGMMFLSALAAWDLGYVDSREFTARLRNTFDTLGRLARHRGHLLNWYDTRTLEPLEPRYVSTVDSGNLAVCLLALKAGCEEAATEPLLRAQLWDGLADTLDVLAEATDHPAHDGTDTLAPHRSALAAFISRARDDVTVSWPVLSEIVAEAFPRFEKAIAKLISAHHERETERLRNIHVWLERARHHLTRMQRDLQELSPWLPLLEAPAGGMEKFALELKQVLCAPISPTVIEDRCSHACSLIAQAANTAQGSAAAWLHDLEAAIEAGCARQSALRDELRELAATSERLAFAMDFRPLYDREARLFHIGYNVSADRLDPSHYDLLASEARLASFFAIAKGDVAFEHWFHLGRPLAREKGGMALISWSGSMFEYLMPPLLLRSAPETLLGQSERTAVDLQRRYAERRGVPWGISESSFASRDADHNYRYRGFGVSELGLRRDLAQDLVVAPYAAALALPVRTNLAVENLRALEEIGLGGLYGLFEAADFTPERRPAGRRFVPVRSYMAHHQGMILAALDNALCTGALVRRFNAHANVRAIALLVQERIPWELPPEFQASELAEPEEGRKKPALPAPHPWQPPAESPLPQIHALGNGSLSSHVSTGGGGGLAWRGHALTRWQPDPTRDDAGLWLYVRDEENGALWSIGRQPTGIAPEEGRIVFHPHMAEFHRRDRGIGTRMEVGVAHDDDVEIRRISIVNESDAERRLRLVSYGEVVLAPALEDERHPAFSKLFVGSEYLPSLKALVFTRRPRRAEEKPPALLHRIICDDPEVEIAGFETDRRSFIGRNGTLRAPQALREVLTGSTGWTLDSVMAYDLHMTLAPGERRQFSLVTMAAESREAVLRLADRYATPAALDWALDDAAMEAAREARQLSLEPARLPELQALSSLLTCRHPALRAAPEVVAANRLGQPRLWSFGISGDHPILLVKAGDPENIDLLHVLIAGLKIWRRRGILADLIVMRPGMSGYVEPLREKLLSLLQDMEAQELLGRAGGVHLILGDQVGEEERRLLEACAVAVLDTARGTLTEQLAAVAEMRPQAPHFEATLASRSAETPDIARPEGLLFDNGYGGFSADGREYVIHLKPGEATPAPWCNVLANDIFGTLVTEAGGGFTWAVNSGENRLTPWTNDPVADPGPEALYLRDEETAEVWTPTPRPAGGGRAHEIRHGAGYTVWRNAAHGLKQRLTVFVPPDDPVKIVRLELDNPQPRPRRVIATYYAEWLLGSLPRMARPFVVCGYDPSCHMLHARNPWNPDFADRVAFLTSSLPPHSFTTDREDFLGREGEAALPAGLTRWDLGQRVRPGADPCAAFQVHLDIEANGKAEAIFILGQGSDFAEAADLAQRWQDPSRCDSAFHDLARLWDRRLGAVKVSTPDLATDLMLNRWLLYQVYSSRLLARAGFYQAGGAYGFRDQLQDVLALLWSEPERARAHILKAAAHQFEEGDVLHWWHPPNGRGVRTRCSDDLLWLPYVAAAYVEATGDEAILEEQVPFLQAPPLTEHEDDRYARYDMLSEPRSLFEHCERALERGITSGAHGLPLIGSGDWNDGMDRVGRKGRGESVWLAWFATATMRRFGSLARIVKRADLAERWESRAREMEEAVEAAAWDGDWYLRAIDDDGNPLGTAGAEECRIDSIAQSWAVLARGVPSRRARTALKNAEGELVSQEARIARLLWPPFDKTPLDPGYIKAYPPGIRENGGQYSHAAAWLGHAFARLGDGDRAAGMFHFLNPLTHAVTQADAEHYRVEPYVVAADIAGVDPHTGQGGWTWYTGAAAWTWRLGIEAILGLKLERGRLMIDPALPKGWGGFKAEITVPGGTLEVEVNDPERVGHGRVEIKVDGKVHEGAIALPADGKTHRVQVRLKPFPVRRSKVAEQI
ncbi:GH36-type glycosyl hydrolase domain-containing protein [Chelativorans alearense]|uniref:GH36-type glycosyl hydrolase domain-containing protein n=1 Tax=Chelativorans alearense TaxID=2681495 RepID=UPI001FE69A45|nr:glucoamylase family protein [Chelativorans alearense]